MEEAASKLEHALIQTRESHNQVIRRFSRGRIESQEFQNEEKNGVPDISDQLKQDRFQGKENPNLKKVKSDSESKNSLNNDKGQSKLLYRRG